jgi:hypothetical protein
MAVEPVLVALVERYKAERLQLTGEGSQQFCRAQNWSRVSYEHQLDTGTLI